MSLFRQTFWSRTKWIHLKGGILALPLIDSRACIPVVTCSTSLRGSFHSSSIDHLQSVLESEKKPSKGDVSFLNFRTVYF